MVRYVSKKIVHIIAKDEKYKNYELEEMEYTLRVILFELVKTTFLIVIFSVFGYFKEIVIILGIMFSIKPFIGGYHEETQIKCFITTGIIAAGILLLSTKCELSFAGNCTLILLSIFSIWNQAPIINPKMPITSLEFIRKNRIRGVTASIIIGFASIILYNYSSYYSIMTWTLVFETMLMFNKREKLEKKIK